MSNRPNYILELKDGRTIEFVPHGQCDHTWVGSGRQFHVSMLEAIGATPVPQPKPKKITFEDIVTCSMDMDGKEVLHVIVPRSKGFRFGQRVIVTVEEKR